MAEQARYFTIRGINWTRRHVEELLKERDSLADDKRVLEERERITRERLEQRSEGLGECRRRNRALVEAIEEHQVNTPLSNRADRRLWDALDHFLETVARQVANPPEDEAGS